MNIKGLIAVFTSILLITAGVIFYFYYFGETTDLKNERKKLEIKKIIEITPGWANINTFIDTKDFFKNSKKTKQEQEPKSVSYINKIFKLLNLDFNKNIDSIYISASDFAYYADYIINIFGDFNRITDKDKLIEQLKNTFKSRNIIEKKELEKDIDIRFNTMKGIEYISSTDKNIPNIIFYSKQRIIFTNLDTNKYINFFLKKDNYSPCKPSMKNKITELASKYRYWSTFDISNRVKSLVRKKISYIDNMNTLALYFTDVNNKDVFNIDIHINDNSKDYKKTKEIYQYLTGQYKTLPVFLKQVLNKDKIPPLYYELASGINIKTEKNIVKIVLILTKEQINRYKKRLINSDSN